MDDQNDILMKFFMTVANAERLQILGLLAVRTGKPGQRSLSGWGYSRMRCCATWSSWRR